MIGSLGNMEVVCQKAGGIASVFYCDVARRRVKRHFLISKVSTCNITLCYGHHVACELQVGWVCAREC